MKQIQIGFPPLLEKAAKQEAKANHESLAAYVRRLIVQDTRKQGAANNEQSTT